MDSPDSRNLNFSNRPVRTRMPGGVGGERSDKLTVPYPDTNIKREKNMKLEWLEVIEFRGGFEDGRIYREKF